MSYLESFLESWLTTHSGRENHRNESVSNVIEKQKNDNVNKNNNRTLLVSPSLSGKTYLMLNLILILSRMLLFHEYLKEIKI